MIGWIRLCLLRRRWREHPRDGEIIGRLGECLAQRFLRRKGYCCIVRNWRYPSDRRAEIDLVCMDGDVLVFVEVKTQSREFMVPAFYRVDKRKRMALSRAAGFYLRGLRIKPLTFRFDIVEVTLRKSGEANILHFQNTGV